MHWVLILAGGAGTRFWPASRALRPKQFLPLSGPDPLIVETARRVLPLAGGYSRVLVASGAPLADETRALLPELPRENLLVEPVPRNTAPCIGWAAATIARRDPDAVVIVLPSDHHVTDVPAFRAVLETACREAEGGSITTVGIQPTHPETGFGYIEVQSDGPLESGRPYDGVRFVEKPSLERAKELCASGRYLWNAGMFIFRARDMLDEIERHLPELGEGLRALDEAAGEGREDEAVRARFGTFPSISIDFAVMEKLDAMRVVPGDFGWSDVGSWQSAWQLATKDVEGNAGPRHAMFVDARDNYVVDLTSGEAASGEQVIALLGTRDLVVVRTGDALLIVPRDRSQDVRAVVDRLKAEGKKLV